MASDDFLDKLIKDAKLGDFRKLRQYVDRAELTIHHDRFDSSAFRDVRKESQELRKVSDIGKETIHDSFDKLLEDAYYSLFKVDPQQYGVNEILDSSLLNHAIMEKGMDLQEWEQLRSYTTLDEWSAAMATISFSEQLEELAKDLKEQFDQASDLAQLEQDIRDAIDQLQNLQGMGQGGGKQSQALQKHINEMLKNLLRQNEQFRKDLMDKDGELRKKIRDAMQNTLDDVENEGEMADAWGSEPGQLQRMSYKERMELGARIRQDPGLKKLAKLAGRVKRLAMGEQSKKIIHGQDEVHDLEVGNNLERLVASEWAKLDSEEMELLFLKQFTEKSLLQYQLRGTEKVGQGPIVVPIDSSGSMGASDRDGFTRDMWAKAVALALLDIAKKQKRTFVALIYGSYGELKEFRFEQGETNINDVLDFASFSFMGGTNWEEPLGRAIEICMNEYLEDGHTRADIVHLSDGCCNVSEEWKRKYDESREAANIRSFGVMICSGGYSYDAEGWQGPFHALNDIVLSVEDVSCGDGGREVFSLV